MPDGVKERKTHEEVRHGLHGLVRQEAIWYTLQPPPSESVSHPIAVLTCQPNEELDPLRGPTLPV
jgi:hypothetical protein